MKFFAFLLRILSSLIIIVGIALIKGSVQTENGGQGKSLYLIIGIILASIGPPLFLFSRKMTAKIWQEVSGDDTRAPVLYLRSFIKDKDGGKTSLHQWWKKFMYVGISVPVNLTTQEEQLKIAFDDIGPMLAVAKPGLILNTLGASKIKFKDEEWKKEVIKLMQKSALILIRAEGNTPNLLWEIEQALKIKHPKRIIFLLPKSQKEYDLFCFTMQQKFRINLPNKKINNSIGDFSGLLYFDSNTNPFIIPIKIDQFLAPSGYTYNNISIGIKNALKNLNLPIFNTYTYEIVTTAARIKAFLYDQVIIIPVCLIAATSFNIIFKMGWKDSIFGGGFLLFFGLQFIYPFFSELYSIKGSFGKRKMGMYVYDKEHIKPTTQQIFNRNFSRLCSFFPFFFFSVPFTLFTLFRNLPLLHDYVSRTRIFRKSNS